MNILFAIILGYLFGSIPSALIISKRKNIDIRKHGSGNIGGTNTFRVLGKKAGLIVSTFDITKGVIPTWLGLHYGSEIIGITAGIFAILGHSYSIFAGFKGGKSVATATGVMLVLNPVGVIFGVITFTLVLFLTKYVSVSSMLAAATVAVSALFFVDSLLIKTITQFIALFIIFRHNTNIRRLLQGNENKAFQKKKK